MADNEVYSLSFSIGGQRYDVRTSDDREEMDRIIRLADEKVTAFQRNRLTYQQALVLTILDFAQTGERAKDDADRFRKEIGAYLKDAEDAKLECEKLKRENERLKKKLTSNT